MTFWCKIKGSRRAGVSSATATKRKLYPSKTAGVSMFRLLFVCILILLVVACVPGDYYSADPELAAIQAQSRADSISQQATVIANRTEVAVAEAMRATDVEQARRDHASATEIALIDKQMEQRKFEIQAQMTEMAIWSSAATATAAPLATQAAYQATLPVARVTQQALERQVRVDEFTEQRAKVMVWMLSVATVLAILWIAWKIGKYIDLKYDILDRNNTVRESREGTIIRVWDPDIEDYLWAPLNDMALTRRLNARNVSEFPVVDAVDFSPGKVTATSSVGNGDNRRLAIELVRDAIGKAKDGENDRVIPRWSELGWTSGKWSDAVSWLKKQKAVSTVERVGTFINYDSLADLLYVLETEDPPTPQ